MIPPGFLQDLLTRVDIVEVVGRHVELKRGGANMMGLCPFHTEKSPSFSVSPSKQFYHCFGCGASGDAIRFLTEHLGLSFVEAVRDLAQGAGLQVPEEQVSADERERRDTLRQRRLSLGAVLSRAADFYRSQLSATPRAIDYLKRRGLTGAVAARFTLGFAPPGWRTLAGVFPNYDEPLLEEAGLVRQRVPDDAGDPADASAGAEPTAAPRDADRERDRGRYDWFRDRVMFPIRSVSGEVIGFGGRVLDDSKPKYINSPETPLFSKGRELYGLFEARQALRDKGYALVVEGYMDVVALAQKGFANAVATLGTACTADHMQKLFRFTDSVVFSFDGDAAGRRAAARALEASLPHASDLRSVKFLFLPVEHDPDSYVRELGAQAFEDQIARAVPLSRQLIEQASADADLQTAEGRARLLAQARPLWNALPDGALKRQLLPELARQGQLGSDDLAALWGLGAAGAPPPPSQGPLRLLRRGRVRTPPAGPADVALRLLLQHADWWERLPPDDQQMLHDLGGTHGEVVRWLERHLVEHGADTWSALNEALRTEPWAERALGWVQAGLGDEEHRFEALHQIVAQLWLDLLRQEATAIATAAPSAEELVRYREILDQIAALKAARLVTPGPN